jgi:hypothetical protein
MSITLAMILAAGMAVGNGPEKISGETEQRLDLRGEWEGFWWEDSDSVGLAEWSEGTIVGRFGHGHFRFLHWGWIKNEGNGRCLVERFRGDREVLGIYHQDGDRLVFCIGRTGLGRPTSFTADEDRHLLILHRVKRRK